MARSSKQLSLVVFSIVGAAGLIWALSRAVNSEAPPQRPAPSGPATFGFAGSASCSARACHGSDRPLDDPQDLKAVALQNEYTTSIMYDKHVQAYSILHGERAKTMARNLSERTGQAHVEAYHDWRCLACHATPESAWAQYQAWEKTRECLLPDPATRNWQLGGVGCEACHGGSMGGKPWLTDHTAKSKWRDLLQPEQKASYGFTNLADAGNQAKICAGCHVGAPPDENRRIPPRDCNHDIMASGHPRLNFELLVFRDNMPPHWMVSRKKEDPAKIWLHGRIGSAKASLELLSYRADQAGKEKETARWPEFAEYRCYACHKGLNTDWRSVKNDPDRLRGSFPYDSWYGSLLPLIDPKLGEGYQTLKKEMAKPMPNPDSVKAAAAKLIEELKPIDASAADLLKKLTQNKSLPADWEDAVQLSLSLAALRKKELQEGDASAKPLIDLAKALSFPTGPGWKGEGPAGIGFPESLKEAQKAYDEFLKTVK